MNDCIYENYPLENLEGISKLILDNQQLYGLNVTIPYKTAIIKFIDHLDNEAIEIGAVNVLKIRRSGSDVKIYGYNSDITGIRETLDPYITGKVKNALVFGTGGSSLAICYFLRKSGIKLIQVSRSAKPGMITYDKVNSDLIHNSQLIINTTPLGMYPDIDSMPEIDYKSLTEEHILFDLVYNPEQTAFLKKGKEQGCKTINGIKMLWSQAEKSWEIWNNGVY